MNDYWLLITHFTDTYKHTYTICMCIMYVFKLRWMYNVHYQPRPVQCCTGCTYSQCTVQWPVGSRVVSSENVMEFQLFVCWLYLPLRQTAVPLNSKYRVTPSLVHLCYYSWRTVKEAEDTEHLLGRESSNEKMFVQILYHLWSPHYRDNHISLPTAWPSRQSTR